MADDDFESFDDLDALDWSDVQDELAANKAAILTAAAGPAPAQNMPDLGALSHAAPSGAAALASAAAGGGSAMTADGNLDINFLLDVQLQISVEVGRTKILIQELLALNVGSIIELKSLIGQPLDIRVNEKLIARGDVVVINDKFGIRITDIISPDDRFATLH